MAPMQDILAGQRSAFMAALPVSIAVRKDRLKRAAAMIADNAGKFCEALSDDFGLRSRRTGINADRYLRLGLRADQPCDQVSREMGAD